jgi:hypothetical protein
MNEAEHPGGPTQGRRIRQRWRKSTLREVYLNDDGTVTKRYWVRPGARRYPKPWSREHAALARLAGKGFPQSHGLTERPYEGGREFVFVRDFVAGCAMEYPTADEAAEIGRVLAVVHTEGVVIDDAAIDNFVKDSAGHVHCIDFGCARIFHKAGIRLSYAAGEELSKLRRKTFFEDRIGWEAFKHRYFADRPMKRACRWALWAGYGVSRLTRFVRKELLVSHRRIRRYRERYGIQPGTGKRFQNGVMLVLPSLACRRELETYIARREFLDLPDRLRLPTHNKRYRVYDLSNFGAAGGRDVILKVSWANPEYAWGRRLNILVLQWIKDYAKIAFLGALAVERIGIKTIRPLACWRYGRTPFDIESYLLYEKRPACSSVLDLARKAEREPTDRNRAELNGVIDQVADMVRRLHDHALRHDDIAMGNFLVEPVEDTATASGLQYTVSMIDTDHVALSGLQSGWIKRVFDMRDLRRLNLDRPARRRFLERYLADDFSETWWRVHMFWWRWGKHPLRLAWQVLTGRRKHRPQDGVRKAAWEKV